MSSMNRNDEREPQESKAPKRPRSALLLLVLVFLAVMALILGSNPFRDQVAEVGFSQYMEQLKGGNVIEVWIQTGSVEAKLAEQRTFDGNKRAFSKIRATIPEGFLQTPDGFDRLTKDIKDASKIHNTGPSFWQAFLI